MSNPAWAGDEQSISTVTIRSGLYYAIHSEKGRVHLGLFVATCKQRGSETPRSHSAAPTTRLGEEMRAGVMENHHFMVLIGKDVGAGACSFNKEPRFRIGLHDASPVLPRALVPAPHAVGLQTMMDGAGKPGYRHAIKTAFQPSNPACKQLSPKACMQ